MNTSETLHFRLPKAVYAGLGRLAALKGSTRTGIARHLIFDAITAAGIDIAGYVPPTPESLEALIVERAELRRADQACKMAVRIARSEASIAAMLATERRRGAIAGMNRMELRELRNQERVARGLAPREYKAAKVPKPRPVPAVKVSSLGDIGDRNVIAVSDIAGERAPVSLAMRIARELSAAGWTHNSTPSIGGRRTKLYISPSLAALGTMHIDREVQEYKATIGK